jgi:lysophospholipase L1-like esterase
MTWHRDILGRLQGTNPRVLFVGDSITYAWTTTGATAWAGFDSYRPANIGIPGDTTQNVLWRLDHGEVAGLRPAVTVVMIGTNDLATYSVPAVTEGIEAVVADLRRRLPRTRILLLGVLPIDPPSSLRHAKPPAINSALVLHYQKSAVTFLDLGDLFAGADGVLRPDLYHRVCLAGSVFCDRLVHPSAAGYQAMTKAVAPVVARLSRGS